MNRRQAAVAVVAALTLLLVPVAFAAKGGGKPGGGGGGGSHGGGGGGTTGGTASISLVVMNAPADGLPHFKGQVTFNISTTATASPYVELQCFQNGAMVLDMFQGFFPTALGNQWFTLGPSPGWQGGAADCTAYVEPANQWSTKLGSTSFHVYA